MLLQDSTQRALARFTARRRLARRGAFVTINHSRKSPEPGTRVVRVALGEFFDQFLADRVHVLGDDDLEHDEQVTLGIVSRSDDALPFDPQLEPAGAPCRNRHRFHAVERGHVDLGAENGLANGDGHLDLKVAPLCLK